MRKEDIEAHLIVTKHQLDKHLWYVAELEKQLAQHKLQQLRNEKTNDR